MVKRMLMVMSMAVAALSCRHVSPRMESSSTTLTVLHAGSLSVPLKALADSFAAQNPGILFRMEAAGSLETIRKLTELGKQADIVASADERLISEYLIPEFASWSLPFAGNEMVVAYAKHSRGRNEINSENWTEMLKDPDIAIGRSNPDLDPCGYRTILLLQLAEEHYGKTGLADKVLAASSMNVRPKETDLIALLQTGHLDYIFTYRSIAVQHKLDFITLPDEVNLSNPDFAENYRRAITQIRGRKPGELFEIEGEAIVYGLTIPNDAPNKSIAARFAAFIASRKGQEILLAHGHRSLSGIVTSGVEEVPEIIRKQLMP